MDEFSRIVDVDQDDRRTMWRAWIKGKESLECKIKTLNPINAFEAAAKAAELFNDRVEKTNNGMPSPVRTIVVIVSENGFHEIRVKKIFIPQYVVEA